MPTLEPLTSNKYLIKDLFNFATEIVGHNCSNFIDSLGIESLFTKIFLEENNSKALKNNIVLGFAKSEFKELLLLATKELYFVFNNILCKQIDGVAMVSPLGSSLANHFWLTLNKIG